MEIQNVHHIFLDTILKSLNQVISEIGEMRALFLSQLGSISHNSSKIEELVENFNARLNKIEFNIDESVRIKEPKTPYTRIKNKKFKKELEYLQIKIKMLTDENVCLRQNNKNNHFPLKKTHYNVSNSDHSISSIQLLDASDQRKLNEKPRLTREFRLDSAPSQSMKPNSSLLSDPLVLKVIEGEAFSTRTERDYNLTKSSRLADIQRDFLELNHLSFLGKNNASPENSLEMMQKEQENQPNVVDVKTQTRSLIILNRKPHKNSASKNKCDENDACLNDPKDDVPILTIGSIKNFNHFQSLLQTMKNTIHFSTYSMFCSDVDTHIHKLEEIFRDYDDLNEKIKKLEGEATDRLKTEHQKTRKKSLENKNESSLVLPLKSNVATSFLTTPIGLLPEIEKLKEKMDMMAHYDKIVEIQNNPSQLESFVYYIKSEYERNLKTYQSLIGVKAIEESDSK